MISDQWSASPQREPEKEAKNMNIENSPQKGADGGGDQQHIVYTYIFPPPSYSLYMYIISTRRVPSDR